MSALELSVYEILKAKLGEQEAQKVIEFIDPKAEEKINNKKDVFLTKDDKIDFNKMDGWFLDCTNGSNYRVVS